jgi:hypothetical protein
MRKRMGEMRRMVLIFRTKFLSRESFLKHYYRRKSPPSQPTGS